MVPGGIVQLEQYQMHGKVYEAWMCILNMFNKKLGLKYEE